MKHLAWGLILVFLASAGLAQGLNTLAVGTKVPDFSLQDTKGQTYKLSEVLNKETVKAVLLTVYASDCGFCVSDMPETEKTYKLLKEKGLRWLGISIDRSKSAAKSFAKKHHLTLINLYDADKKVAQSLKYARTPHSVLVGKNREVVRVYAGTNASLQAQMRNDLIEYLSTGKVTSAPPATGGG